jgi:hypothetical protein
MLRLKIVGQRDMPISRKTAIFAKSLAKYITTDLTKLRWPGILFTCERVNESKFAILAWSHGCLTITDCLCSKNFIIQIVRQDALIKS